MARFFILNDSSFFLLDNTSKFVLASDALLAESGFTITIAGVEWPGVIVGADLRLRLEGNSSATLKFRLPASDARTIDFLDEVVITDVASGTPVFGGYADKIDDRRFVDRRRIVLRCVGYSWRLGAVELDQDQGIAVAEETTPAGQLGLIAGYAGLSDDVADAGTVPSPVDARFVACKRVVEDIRILNGAIIVATPSKTLTAHLRGSLPSSGLTLDENVVLLNPEPEYRVTWPSYITDLTVLGGQVVRTQTFTGNGSKRAFRIGGAEGAQAQSFFSAGAGATAEGALAEQGVRFTHAGDAAGGGEVSLFDSSINGGFTDPDISDATAGCPAVVYDRRKPDDCPGHLSRRPV